MFHQHRYRFGQERRTRMRNTYQAVEVSAPGTLRVVERPVSEPGAGQVRIRVEACGICHTDAATVTSTYPGLNLPRVPGHEVVGRIEALGNGVSRWKIGQRVGVGFFGGEDGVCEPCRRGDIVNCQNPVIPGVTVDGGYAEVMIAEARGIASIPDELTSAEAAPLLENIRPMIETVPPEQAADAYARMMQGKARFRMALDTKGGVAQSAPINGGAYERFSR